MASSSNRRGKANTTRPWTTAKEITLCTAWCNAMEMYGSGDITKKGFWSDVLLTLRKTWEELFENTMSSSANGKIRYVPNRISNSVRTSLHNGGVLKNFEKSSCLDRN
ncbi:hypothetical protein Tco_0737833 [Tanacetum coccineum]